ncbi:1-acylglycerol-3-phosphate O-acyltransferase [Marinomonas sp. C2222]|uniref:1-acyl-sn-glycerol-3-phosphate acyltransferase n=1 Tax=Marinomonas sargassi TaxID=2984494 RepID=A0ABT2YVN3_9GAMM|nr:1-acylglycerol-3-phosphate O-acyltransferase [Marinomonas sargassi]MCV2403962.1 1-acylglycerol-3-phosphate O-acyltransferase [Marinomonas sargassi]
MLLFIRLLLLSLLVVCVTFFGFILCLLTLWSKNRVYYIAKVFSAVAPCFGLQVESRIAPAAAHSPQAVYIANHQNNFDLFTIAKVLPKRMVAIGKSTLLFIPFFGLLYWASGNIIINRNNSKKAIATIDQVVASMKKNQTSILMFPEGTRSRGRGWLPFKRGAFHAAVQAGVPIVPIVCSSTHQQVNLNRWNNGKVIVEMLEPIDTSSFDDHNISELLSYCEEQMHATQARLDKELGK